MIEISASTKLKESGLEWEPKPGDYCAIRNEADPESETTEILLLYNQMDLGAGRVVYVGSNPANPTPANRLHDLDTLVWMPRLEQLLSEIEKQGWEWTITSGGSFYLTQSYRGYPIRRVSFKHETPVGSAAEALQWLLSQQK
ncbi:MAG: hypothetical protein HPY50_20130 [Firmicutes bacterium]|nr:hypothetical protein [Bacillota bacterium]